MSGELVTAVLSEAFHKFGRFTPENQREVSQWVQRRVNDIKSGAVPVATVAHPTLPKTFRSWYDATEREPGADDE